jgi:hypothetical protein
LRLLDAASRVDVRVPDGEEERRGAKGEKHKKVKEVT